MAKFLVAIGAIWGKIRRRSGLSRSTRRRTCRDPGSWEQADDEATDWTDGHDDSGVNRPCPGDGLFGLADIDRLLCRERDATIADRGCGILSDRHRPWCRYLVRRLV